MGVPAFFRWLSRKYPSILVHCVEEKGKEVDGQEIPVDITQKNPNQVEFDNLYLDMNGIIHPCCHPEEKPPPKNEDEMMVNIFEYIDRLMNIVRPRRLLYMAIDGVAPRAKMNQQRSRRFRSAKEATEKQDAIDEVRRKLEEQGMPLPAAKKKEEHFDSNCITPGTPFMARLAECLRYYVHLRMNSDPLWQNLEVILSDANVPGEGEHKIMDFIRKQRASAGHDPNVHHCLCGADADLIMLGLATHEPNFTIIREEFIPFKQVPCELCGQFGHVLKECQGLPRENMDKEDMPFREKNFIFLRISVLREYLFREMQIPNLPFKFDIERAIDDWVFMCFFVGNDFLPHLPSLEIREHAIDRLIELYKKAVYRTGGYITDSGKVNLSRVQLILSELGEAEDEIFKKRQQDEISFRERNKAKKRRMKTQSAPSYMLGGQYAPMAAGRGRDRPGATNDPRNTIAGFRQQAQGFATNPAEGRREEQSANRNAARQLKASLSGGGSTPDIIEIDSSDATTEKSPAVGSKRKQDQSSQDSDEEEAPPDDVRLWEEGWKERYYQAKFEVSAEDVEYRQKVAHAYAEGLCWVLRYYYQGCASWKWFFPFHYAPFASDFFNLGDVKIDFELNTEPFKPMEQLMGVFPAASRKHVPSIFGGFMIDPTSVILDFYPNDFKVDLNGKKYAWQGVALLPFVEEKRLLSAITPKYKSLTRAELERNTKGCDRLFVYQKNRAYSFLQTLYEDDGYNEASDKWVPLNYQLTRGMSGELRADQFAVMENKIVDTPVPQCGPVRGNMVMSAQYRNPEFEPGHFFLSNKLPGAIDPEPTLKPEDWNPGRQGSYRPQTGFNRNMPRASLGGSGHRFVQSGTGQYSNMPPQQFRGPYPSQGYGGSNQGNNPRSNYNGSGWNNNQGSQPYDDRRASAGGNLGWQQNSNQQRYAHQSNYDRGRGGAPRGGGFRPPNSYSQYGNY